MIFMFMISSVITFFYADSKGYSVLAWFFAAGPIGLLLMFFLPNVELDSSSIRVKRKGDAIGIILSVMTVFALVAYVVHSAFGA